MVQIAFLNYRFISKRDAHQTRWIYLGTVTDSESLSCFFSGYYKLLGLYTIVIFSVTKQSLFSSTKGYGLTSHASSTNLLGSMYHGQTIDFSCPKNFTSFFQYLISVYFQGWAFH